MLLDCGALMLGLSNEQVAREWIKLTNQQYEATVYFNTNNVLMVVDRKGVITEFEISTYRCKLDKCLVNSNLENIHRKII